jgi:hypothetical protein
MKLPNHSLRLARAGLGWVLMLLAACFAGAAESSSGNKPVFLYSRYYNAQGENRYAPDGDYKELLQRLSHDFKVRVHNEPLTARTLDDVRILLIANPSDQAFKTNPPPPHVSQRDIRTLRRFVRRGGGLILMENQENHNLEIHDTNKLLAQFGMQATNQFTDAKLLLIPKEAPLMGGLRWAYYSGNLLLLDPAHPTKPRALVTNDLTQIPLSGNRDEPGVLMATSRLGRGRFVVVTDSGWLADWALNDRGAGGNVLRGQDNWEIFRRLVRWMARLDYH